MKDYIVVGFGLAGASISFQLEKMNKDFIVFENHSQASSKVAAGLMNPVILKRFTLAWKADIYLDKAVSFYRELETYLRENFIASLEVYRKFFSVEEQNNWFSAADNFRTGPFLDTQLQPEINKDIPAQFSFGKVNHTYRVNTEHFLKTYAEKLLQEKKLQFNEFDYTDLNISAGGILYKGIEARNIIFCEGFGILKNPYFNYLPLTGNKGEYITIKAKGLNLSVAVKSSVFIIPLGNDFYKVGATYNNIDKTAEPTTKAREEIMKKLDALISVPYEIVDQVAGIRPSTGDRRPLAGQHPEYKNLFCCNGFGSRGVMMAPAISEELLNFIENKVKLSPEIDISRFIRRWKIKN